MASKLYNEPKMVHSRRVSSSARTFSWLRGLLCFVLTKVCIDQIRDFKLIGQSATKPFYAPFIVIYSPISLKPDDSCSL
jgi:hypothetical protein